MPWTGVDFIDGQIGELIVHTISFSDGLSDGESIATSTTWTVAVAADSPVSDPSPAAIISGIATHGTDESYQVINFKTAGVAGVKYRLTAEVVTNLGNTIIRYAHKTCAVPR